MQPHWLQVKNEGDQPEILIDGYIGQHMLDESGMSGKEFCESLNQFPKGKPVKIKSNSQGGSVMDGLLIFNSIAERADDITFEVVGYAVSTGSWFGLGAKNVVTPKSAMWMIHESTSGIYGNKGDMAKGRAMLAAHDEMIVGLYSRKTGMPQSKIREMMEKETWFDGEQAAKMGFAQLNDSVVNLAPIAPRNEYRNIPENILKASSNAGHTQPVVLAPPVTPPASNLSDGGNAAAVENSENTQTKENSMSKENEAAATPAATAINVDDIVNRVVSAIESKLPKEAPGAAPIMANSIEMVGDANDKLVTMMAKPEHTPAEAFKIAHNRRAYIVNAWGDICKARVRSGKYPKIENVNTVAAALTTDLLNATVVTNIQTMVAGLQAMSLLISEDPLKPKAVVQVPNVTAGATVQTSPTDWESGDATVAAIAVTPLEYSSSFHITNAQLQSGTQIEWLTRINAEKLAIKIMEVAMVPVTVANFGAASFTGSAVGFTPDDLAAVRADIKNNPIKNLIIDGAYWSRLVPANKLGFELNQGAGGYGFNAMYENNSWLNTIIGFACAPQAIVGVAGLPIDPPAGGSFTSIGSAVIPGVNLPIQTSSWTAAGTRVQWMAYDLIFGVAVGDTGAGTVMTSE